MEIDDDNNETSHCDDMHTDDEDGLDFSETSEEENQTGSDIDEQDVGIVMSKKWAIITKEEMMTLYNKSDSGTF